MFFSYSTSLHHNNMSLFTEAGAARFVHFVQKKSQTMCQMSLFLWMHLEPEILLSKTGDNSHCDTYCLWLRF